MTLVEVLVVSAVFGLILGLITQAMVTAYKAQARTASHTESYRSALLMAARLERELNTCHNFQGPIPMMSGLVTPLTGNPLRFVRNDETSAPAMTTGVSVNYYYDPLAREVLRSDNRNPKPRVVARGVQNFAVNSLPRHIDVVLQVDYAPDPIRLHTTPCKI
ncbi:hypothetical protein JST97_38315 [bacterium]|nr:hypothetical protein [bacterium]